MKQYKFILKPRSMYSDIFMADTLWGTACWYIYYIYGNKVLETFLNDFVNTVPFIISSLIPQGYIPKPHLPFALKESVDDIEYTKKLKSLRWIPIEVFKKFQSNYNQDEVAKKIFEVNQSNFTPLKVQVTRNSISRIFGTVLEGKLFTDSYYYNDVYYNVYVTEFTDTYSEIFTNAFMTACQMGIGGNASIGKGVFDVKIEELNDLEKDVFNYKGKHFLTLSECAGSNLDALCYTTVTKYGKLGGEFSQKGINGLLLFNKKPVILYQTGSTFNSGEGIPGTMLNNVHNDSRIKQYAYAYPVYFDWSMNSDTQ